MPDPTRHRHGATLRSHPSSNATIASVLMLASQDKRQTKHSAKTMNNLVRLHN